LLWPCRSKASKAFFSEEKKQKTFVPGAAYGACKLRRAMGAVAKVFWFFFSKKNRFALTKDFRL
jgi:hypothetical protein